MSVPARYNDGVTAQVRMVTAELWPGQLVFKEQVSDAPVAAWKLDDIQILDEIKPGQPVRLTSSKNPASRLTLADDAFIQSIEAALPAEAKTAARQIPSWTQVFTYIVLVLAGVWGIYLAAPVALQVATNALPLSWEVKLGDKFINGFKKSVEANDKRDFCTGNRGNDVLDGLVDRLAQHADSPFKFRVYVTNHKQVNAFAAPGGHIILFIGLIHKAKSPDEVAAVLAHEMAHIIKRHSANAIIRQQGLSFVFDLLLGDGLFSTIGQTFTALSYGRDLERDADAVGLELLEKENISVKGFQTFFAQLAEDHKNVEDLFKYLSTHPTSASRAALVSKHSNTGKPAMTAEEWTAVRFMCP